MSLAANVLEGVIYGASLGMLYVLVALGLTLIFGLMEVVNFAHGAFVTLGAYLGITFLDLTGSFWLSMVLAGVVVGVLGLAIERTVIRRLYGEEPIYQLLLTFGLALLLEGVVILTYGQDNQLLSAPALLQGSPVPVGPATVPQYRVFLIVFTGVLVAAMADSSTSAGSAPSFAPVSSARSTNARPSLSRSTRSAPVSVSTVHSLPSI